MLTGRAVVVAGHDCLLVVAKALPVIGITGLDAGLGGAEAGLDNAVFGSVSERLPVGR